MATILKKISPSRIPLFLISLYILTIPFESILLVPTVKGLSISTVLGGIAALFFIINIIIRQKKIRIPADAYLWMTVFLWVLVSAVWSVDSLNTLNGFWNTVKFLFLFLIIVIYVFDKEEISTIKRSIILSGVIASALIIVYYALGLVTVGDGRTTLAFGSNVANPNNLAASLILPFAMQLGRLMMYSKGKHLMDIIFFILIFAAVIITGSRGGLISIFGVLIAMFILVKPTQQENKIVFSIASMLIVITYLLLPYLPEELVQRFIPSGDLDGFSTNRITVWQAGLDLWQKNPLLGYGFNNFYPMMLKSTGLNWAAHNLYLQFLVELGPFGLAFLLFIFWKSFSFIAKSSLAISAKAALAGLAIASFSSNIFNYDYFWLTFIMIIIAKNYERNSFEIKVNEYKPKK